MRGPIWLLVVLALVLVGCATAGEQIAGATEPTVEVAASTVPSASARTAFASNVQSIEPIDDTPVQDERGRIVETDDYETRTRGEKATQVSQEPAPTSEPELAQEPRSTIEARSRVTIINAEALPEHPFEGLVQLAGTSESDAGWLLRFYQWTDSGVGRGWTVGEIPLPELAIDCLGDVGLISRGTEGIEIGGPLGSVSASFLIPWGGTPERLDAPSDELLAEVMSRPSNVDAAVTGDFVNLRDNGASVGLALREPARREGDWWIVQARHDGDVFVMTAHPSNHPCFSGVTWLSAAGTGELLACGADMAATRFVVSESQAKEPLVLPAAAEFPDVLSCPYPLSHLTLEYGQPQ